MGPADNRSGQSKFSACASLPRPPNQSDNGIIINVVLDLLPTSTFPLQRENLELCVLVQKALMKSICLAASFSIEAAHMGGVDDVRFTGLAVVDEEE